MKKIACILGGLLVVFALAAGKYYMDQNAFDGLADADPESEEYYRIADPNAVFETDISDDEAGGYCISFAGKVKQFNQLSVGKGKDEYAGMYLNLTDTEIQIFTAIDKGMIARYNHSLQIKKYVKIFIHAEKNGEAVVCIETKGGKYEVGQVPWTGWQGSLFVDPQESSLADCELSYRCEDWDEDVWLFGDSYFAANRNDRWTYYLLESGYENFLLNAWPGRNSAQALESLKLCLNYHTPKTIVWCLGMNDGSDEDEPSENWMTAFKEVEEICKADGIELILGTIPNVPVISNRLKNEYIRSSGYRYIDFAKAVGSEEDDTWYPDMLEEGELRVHPTKEGAKALYEEAKDLLAMILQ